MAQYYQGQKAQDANGNMLVYDVKKGWQAMDQSATAAYRGALANVKTQREAYTRIKDQAPLLQQADRMVAGVPDKGSMNPLTWLAGGGGNNGKVQTGGILNQDGEKNKSWGPAMSADASTFQSLGSRIQTQGGNPAQGQGAVSDYERKLFSAGAPSLAVPNSTNQGVIAQRQAIINEQRDYANFLDDYVQHHGNDQGAQEVWQHYVAADPYYGPSSKDPSRFVAYTKDQDRWRRFIYGGHTVAPQGVQPQAQPQQHSGGWSVTRVK